MKHKRFLSFCFVLALSLLGIGIALELHNLHLKSEMNDMEHGTELETEAQLGTGIVEYNGKKYRYNDELQNILILGVDVNDAFQSRYLSGEAGQADLVVLLTLDPDAQTAEIVEINRNTMTNVDHYDDDGNYAFSTEEQLALQYAYAIGAEYSCGAMMHTVSELMYGIPIEHYVVVNCAGIQSIVDSVDGVDVTISQDYTELNPQFIEGSVVHMDGSLAETYVRSRDVTKFDSATDRLHRQTDFIRGMLTKARQESPEKLISLYWDNHGKYFFTNLTPEILVKCARYSFDTGNILYVPGETVMGAVYEEFHVNEDEFQQMIIDHYYIEVP